MARVPYTSLSRGVRAGLAHRPVCPENGPVWLWAVVAPTHSLGGTCSWSFTELVSGEVLKFRACGACCVIIYNCT